MAIAIQVPPQEVVNTTEALWSLIVGQKKSVQKTLATRLTALLADEKREAQQAYVRESLTHAIQEARQAHATGKPLPDARNLFDELDD